NGDFVRGLIRAGRITACHDLSDGGLAVALAEMAMASGLGCTVAVPAPAHVTLFAEDQARYLVTCPVDAADALLADAAAAGVAAERIGTVAGDRLIVEGHLSISVGDLKRAHEDWFPTYMAHIEETE
ncbi:MAG TPA: AIR synthase-related protein, partial [Kaistiaceae bacterium]|nr:AIR synthase-related protein [Kaistiaceae bacterium]